MSSIDLDRAAQIFAAASDLTIGIEEEFAILDPETHELAPRFEELRDAASADEILRDAVAGELISSEIEIISGVGSDLQDAISRQRERRRRLFALAEAHGAALGATGTHPWADYRNQPIIDTEHYRRVEDGLKYVAWRNNTFSLHVHVGVRDIDRAVRACDRLRPVLPLLLAVSANSPYLDGRDSGLHSARTQAFTKSFPRCGIPDAFGSWDAYREYIEFLVRTNSIVEFTQVWWSIRPHFAFGTVELRICDAQATASESEALAALMVACIAQAVRDDDEGLPLHDPGAAADRGEPLAGDPLRHGRPPDRPRAGGGVPGTLGPRAAGGVDRAGALGARHLAVLPGVQRRPAPAPDDRRRGQPRGGLRGLRGGDQAELQGGGGGLSTPEDFAGSTRARRAQRGGAEGRLRGGTEPHHDDRHDRPGDDLAPQPRRPQAGAGGRRGRRRARGGQDLEQVRDAIDATRALMGVLERRIPQELPPLRDALSRLQMAYAQEVQRAPGAAGSSPGAEGSAGRRRADDGGRPPRPGGRRPAGAGGVDARAPAGRAAARGLRAAPARAGRVQRAPVGARQISCSRARVTPRRPACGGAAR